MLINLTNHPFEEWPEEQVNAAKLQFGSVRNLLPKPVPPDLDSLKVLELAHYYVKRALEILSLAPHETNGILITGEYNFTWCCINLLQQKGFGCYAATTERLILEKEKASIKRAYSFVQFRKYLNPSEIF